MLAERPLQQAPALEGRGPERASLDELTRLNIADICTAFGLAGRSPLRGPAELLLRPPARRFARQLAALDAIVGAAGLQAGGAWICGQLAAAVDVAGPPSPEQGPLLIVANHPGLLDAAALFASIPRRDLRILAIRRPFLRALPNIAAALLPVGETAAARMAALRAAARHLRAGGALLTFPAGKIEPDPISMPGAADSLADWSESLDLLARLAGEVTVAPMIVGGVITPAALRHPLTRLRREQADRRWLAAIVQLMLPRLGRTTVRVRRAAPIVAGDGAVSQQVIAAARRLIKEIAQP